MLFSALQKRHFEDYKYKKKKNIKSLFSSHYGKEDNETGESNARMQDAGSRGKGDQSSCSVRLDRICSRRSLQGLIYFSARTIHWYCHSALLTFQYLLVAGIQFLMSSNVPSRGRGDQGHQLRAPPGFWFPGRWSRFISLPPATCRC